MFLKNLSNEKGAIFVWLIVNIVLLMGILAFVADVGLIYFTRQKMVNAVDTAALAGARFLNEDANKAKAEAAKIAEQNGLLSSEVTVNYDPLFPNHISVDAQRVVKLIFAPLLGFNEKLITAHARAAIENITSVKGAVPFGVADNNDFQYNQLYKLKVGPGESEGGNFGCLALGGKGADVYRNNIKYGYDGTVSLDQIIQTQPGNMAGPTQDGVTYRLGQCKDGCVFDNFKPGCPRFIIAPVVEAEDVLKGRSEVQVIGFAAFFLEGTETIGEGKKAGHYVVGRFIKWVAQGGYQSGAGGNNYGLSQVKLVE